MTNLGEGWGSLLRMMARSQRASLIVPRARDLSVRQSVTDRVRLVAHGGWRWKSEGDENS